LDKIIHVISTNNIARGMVRGDRKYAFNPPKICFRLNILFWYYPPTYSHYITTDIVPVRWNDLFLGPSEPRVILLNRTAAAINSSTPGDSVDPRTPTSSYRWNGPWSTFQPHMGKTIQPSRAAFDSDGSEQGRWTEGM
jgi:hypothetical protein